MAVLAFALGTYGSPSALMAPLGELSAKLTEGVN